MNFNDVQFPAKPECSYGEVIATDRGWEVLQPSGYSEILVSWPNMKSEMDRIAAKDAKPVEEEEEEGSDGEQAEGEQTEQAEQAEGEQGEQTEQAEGEQAEGEQAAPAKHVYTKEELEAMKMDALRPIGVEFDVRDTSKAELIAKILAAQAAQ